MTGGALIDVDGLMALFDKRDGRTMSIEIEKLLHAGRTGWEVIYKFFDRCDKEDPKILTLAHDAQLTYGLVRVVHLFPRKTGEFIAYLMKATESQKDSFIRREIFNFLPQFLRFHEGEFSTLRENLTTQLDLQLEAGGEYLYKTLLAIDKLGYSPPVEKFVPILNNPAVMTSHNMAIEHLAKQGEEGVKALGGYLASVTDFNKPTPRTALRVIADLETVTARQIIQTYLKSPHPVTRESAVVAYFIKKRDVVDSHHALAYLNSNAEFRRKRSFVRRIARSNKDILSELQSNPAKLLLDDVRAMVAQGGVTSRSKR